MEPIIEELKNKYNLNIIKYDSEDNDFEFDKYKITDKIPVLILIDDLDNEIGRLTGEKNKKEIEEFINKYTNKGE